MGPATRAVGRWYREFDLGPADDYADLSDHVATELEFAAYLAEESTEERLEQRFHRVSMLTNPISN